MFICYAFILCIMVIRLAPSNTYLAKWGECTLFIYVYHTLALKLLFQLINRNYLPQNEYLLAIES
jgi:fucose 4-O-acetylase-like acetyltransferase